MAVTGINHVALRVRDLEVSRKFYELLGFRESGHREDMLFFAAPGHHHHIAMLQAEPEAVERPRHCMGVLHFAVTVEAEAELGRLYSLLEEAGYRIRMTIDHFANRSFYVEDPDGNIVEVTYDVPRAEWEHLGNPFGQDRPYDPPGRKTS